MLTKSELYNSDGTPRYPYLLLSDREVKEEQLREEGFTLHNSSHYKLKKRNLIDVTHGTHILRLHWEGENLSSIESLFSGHRSVMKGRFIRPTFHRWEWKYERTHRWLEVPFDWPRPTAETWPSWAEIVPPGAVFEALESPGRYIRIRSSAAAPQELIRGTVLSLDSEGVLATFIPGHPTRIVKDNWSS